MTRSILFLFLVPFLLCAGKLEDFADDVEYLEKSYKEVEKLPTTSAYKVEYRKRLVGAKNRAYELQRAIEKLGIKKTSLDTTLNKMISCMDIGGVANRSVSTQSGNLGTHANELRRQIAYLQELNYSFEANTFEDPYPESNTYEAVHRFDALLKSAYRITQGKGYINEETRKKYDETFNDLMTLGKTMSMQIRKEQLKLPQGFNLIGNLEAFHTAAEKVLTVRNRKDAANSKKLKRLTGDKGYKEALNTVKYAAERLENEIEFLKRANFDMRVRKENLLPAGGRPILSEDEVTDKPKQHSFADLWKKYTEAKEKVFRSESKLRGVSDTFYNNYRKLLTTPQQEELDALRQKFLKEELSPELARSMAVKTIHTKYRFSRKEYTVTILADILKKNGLL